MKVLGVRHSARWGLPDGHLVDNPPPMDLLRGLLKERDIEMILTRPSRASLTRITRLSRVLWREVARSECPLQQRNGGHGLRDMDARWSRIASVDTTSRMSRKMQAVREYESQLDRFNLEGLVEGLGRYSRSLVPACAAGASPRPFSQVRSGRVQGFLSCELKTTFWEVARLVPQRAGHRGRMGGSSRSVNWMS